MHVLIVDDDIVDRESIKRSLHQSSFECKITEAFNVDSGLSLCQKQNFDVILLDYQLPQRDGIELLIELRLRPELTSEVIVMMSNSEDESIALQCIENGAQDFLLKKEISAVKLRRTIMQAQKRFELERELKLSFDQVKQLAERDSLTNLANRYLFDETFKAAVINNQRHHFGLALILFDLDNFKLINDSFGHSAGDQLLTGICERITSVLRGNELFARLGGDEFAILLTDVKSPFIIERIAHRIKSSMKSPFTIEEKAFKVSISIGISIDEGFGKTTAEELLTFADIAMYRSKNQGRGQISFFEDAMHQQTQRRLTLENGVANALTEKEFHLVYQPVFEAQSKQLAGFEALIRWQSSTGLIPPDEFIPIAEKSHQIITIGRWIVSEAIQQIGLWNKSRSEPLRISINLSPAQLRDNGFVVIVKNLCERHGVAPHLIEFELTETAILESNKQTLAFLDDLVSLGCTLALDDFGTGYSSIAHLNTIPLSTVKLDKSLLPVETSSGKTTALITGLVHMLKALNLNIVAEGVETEAHERLCKNLDVTLLQGFYYNPGLSAITISEQYIK